MGDAIRQSEQEQATALDEATALEEARQVADAIRQSEQEQATALDEATALEEARQVADAIRQSEQEQRPSSNVRHEYSNYHGRQRLFSEGLLREFATMSNTSLSEVKIF